MITLCESLELVSFQAALLEMTNVTMKARYLAILLVVVIGLMTPVQAGPIAYGGCLATCFAACMAADDSSSAGCMAACSVSCAPFFAAPIP